MKKSQILLLILIFIIYGCSQQKKSKLNGVWYNIESSQKEEYYEAHITDTGFVVVNQGGLSYLSSYKINDNILIQYLRDPFSNRKILDTLNFDIDFIQNSFVMTNTINQEANSKWIKIPNIEPFEFYENQSIEGFALDLRKRYFENYVSKFIPEDYAKFKMDYFDIDWNIKND